MKIHEVFSKIDIGNVLSNKHNCESVLEHLCQCMRTYANRITDEDTAKEELSQPSP